MDKNISLVTERVGTSTFRIKASNIPNTYIFYIAFSGTPFCCGMVELGNIMYYVNTNFSDEDIYAVLLKELPEFLRQFTASNNRKYFVISQLRDNRACNLIKRFFIETKLFTHVDTFENLNTGNMLTTWINKPVT